MTSVKVKFTPSSVILKEGTVHYQIIHHCKVRHIRTGYKLFPSEWISASSEINVYKRSATQKRGSDPLPYEQRQRVDFHPGRTRGACGRLSCCIVVLCAII